MLGGILPVHGMVLRGGGFVITRKEAIQQMREGIKEEWCLALHGNHDEHQCHLERGHVSHDHDGETCELCRHECTCGVCW